MKLIEDLHEYTTRYEALGGYNSAGEVEKVLFGLGFKPEDLDKDLSQFSGGWRMRVELAKILLMNHDLMLLDEPTNHLDIESILWLESFMKDHPAAVLMVSHDRIFMDNITKRTIELVNAKAYDYPASYSKFMELREERRLQQIATRKNQEKEVRETQMLIDKFRAKASKASFAQSLIKRLDKMELTEVDDMENSRIHFRFPPAPRSGKVALKVENLCKNFGEKKVLQGVDLEVERNDRIAFIGQNGQGKTTMVRMIMKDLEKSSGTIELGHNVSIGYYAQEQTSALDGDKTVLETIESIAPDDIRPRVRSLLGAFMFGGEDEIGRAHV
jgi:ATP-binding cassette subfamily F protein 3